MVFKWWLFIVIFLLDGWISNTPLIVEAFTLEGYFRILALAARKRDMWRKIFLGNDVGFEASPFLFKDRVMPPYVPIVKSFPKYPVEGHYRNERAPSNDPLHFPQFYSNLQLSHRLPPPPGYYRRPKGGSYPKRHPRQNISRQESPWYYQQRGIFRNRRRGGVT